MEPIERDDQIPEDEILVDMDEVPEEDGLLAGDPANPATKAALTTLYGGDFPLAKEDPRETDWVGWAEGLWAGLEAGMARRMHEVQRNRMFRQGHQWIASNGVGPWREPPKPSMAARPVTNLIAPALDQRVQIASEQRPGFRARPATQDPTDQKRAEAIQAFLEYQFDQQERTKTIREALYWVGTDGACFEEVYWHPDRGPWDEEVGAPLGDPCSRVRRIEQVRVSANASSTQRPYYWVIRDLIPREQAVAEYGETVSEGMESGGEDPFGASSQMGGHFGLLGPDTDELLRERDLVARFTVYCEKSEFLPQGLTAIVVGKTLVYAGGLLCGVVPMVRWTDGSTDPAFFPKPEMNKWIPAQMRVNAAKAKFYENLRYNAGPKILGRSGAIKGETLLGGTMTVVEVGGLGGLNENVQIIPGQSVAPDVEKAIAMEVRDFENLTGWNDTTRGSFGADQSGRAILAIREQVERVFAPLVVAASESQTEWAKVTLAWGKWGYDLPRMLAVQGDSRPDLARSITAEDLDGAVDVWIDPETLMPMPRSLKLFLMKDMVQMGTMTPQEYRRRSVFGWVRNLGSPDEDQEARARRVVESIRQGQPLPMLWVDDEAIHQDVLQRELLLPDDVEPSTKQLAQQRWDQLGQQQQMKMGGAPPAGPPGGGPPSGGGKPLQLPPGEQPFQGTNPGIAATTASQLGGAPDGQMQAQMFESQQPF